MPERALDCITCLLGHRRFETESVAFVAFEYDLQAFAACTFQLLPGNIAFVGESETVVVHLVVNCKSELELAIFGRIIRIDSKRVHHFLVVGVEIRRGNLPHRELDCLDQVRLACRVSAKDNSDGEHVQLVFW